MEGYYLFVLTLKIESELTNTGIPERVCTIYEVTESEIAL